MAILGFTDPAVGAVAGFVTGGCADGGTDGPGAGCGVAAVAPPTMLTGILGSALALERDEMYACGAPLLYFTDAAALELTETWPIGETYQITIFYVNIAPHYSISSWPNAFSDTNMHEQTQRHRNAYVCMYMHTIVLHIEGPCFGITCRQK